MTPGYSLMVSFVKQTHVNDDLLSGAAQGRDRVEFVVSLNRSDEQKHKLKKSSSVKGVLRPCCLVRVSGE